VGLKKEGREGVGVVRGRSSEMLRRGFLSDGGEGGIGGGGSHVGVAIKQEKIVVEIWKRRLFGQRSP